MKSTSIAIAALASTAVAQESQLGTAHVVNECAYPVYLSNVPAAGGGGVESDTTLAAFGGTWSNQYQILTNGQGWSIKLSKADNLDQIMQYEYTVHGDGDLWFDLSDVNGNPFDGAWQINATGNSACKPVQHAYMYPKDDAYGEQYCPQDANVIVTLCGGAQGSDGSASSYGAPAPAPATTSAAAPPPAPTSTYVAPSTPAAVVAPASSAAPAASAWNGQGWAAGENRAAVASTTLSTAVTTPAPSPVDGNVLIVTTTVVAYTTVDVAPPTKRDVENHHQHHLHHARHPHGGRL